jgi:hypothetical protein
VCGHTVRWVVDWLFIIDDYGQYLYSTGIIIASGRVRRRRTLEKVLNAL